jgi:hypothetical protein
MQPPILYISKRIQKQGRPGGADPDKSGSDVSRACFLPYDPDCFINPKYL